MTILIVGVSHRTAPLHVLERLSLGPAALDSLLGRLKSAVAEAFVLSTCNRTEICAVTADAAHDAERLLQLLAELAGDPVDALRPVARMLTNQDAVLHALRVASGLESMVLGEDQIQAQFKRALASARGMEVLGPTLDRLGAAALACGKQVRACTGIGQHAVSLESLAVRTALDHLATRHDGHAVVLGSGSSAALVTQQLRDAGLRVTLVGRRQAAAADLAAVRGAECAPWEQLPDVLVGADAVFCCTAAPHPVLTVDTLARRRQARPETPLVCVDLGMPRDVEPTVAALPGVTLVALRDLAGVADAHRAARARHVPAAEGIVAQEAQRFAGWLETRGAVGAITQRRAEAAAVADAELGRALARLQTTSAHDRAVVADLARRLVGKLMHLDTAALTPPAPPRRPARQEALS